MSRLILACLTNLAGALQQPYGLLDVAQQQRPLELRGHVLADLRDLHHLAQLVQVARDQVQEGQFIEVLCTLVAHLYDLGDK